MPADARTLTAREAADLLGIHTATLYAYVSRGLLRSELGDGATRARRYLRADVEALLARKEYRRAPTKAAADSLAFGMPVLDSSITLIDGGRLFYRGKDALHLAQEQTFEEVAALLWTGDLARTDLFARFPTADPGAALEAIPLAQPIERSQAVLALAAVQDLAAHQITPAAVAGAGARILHLLTEAITGAPFPAAAGGSPAGAIAAALQAAWRREEPATGELFSAALILCADHELNVSAFTARCVASAGSSPYAVVIAALSALQGFRHGGHTVLVSALLAAAAHGVRPAVAAYLQNGAALPGFGHRLYPEGDPRARCLLALLAARYPHAPAVALAGEICAAVEQSLGLHPSIDFALAVLVDTVGAPRHASLALFALGRTAGWIAHALEQYAEPHLIRPRARYRGIEPQREDS